MTRTFVSLVLAAVVLAGAAVAAVERWAALQRARTAHQAAVEDLETASALAAQQPAA